jgi:RNA polymerase sigma-70 factor (ECF subfamily)
MTTAIHVRSETPAEPADEELVSLVRRGDLRCYETLMRRNNRRLYRAVRAVLRDESEVEDVLQEAYLAAYRRLDEFQGRARFSTWLIRIALNKALDERRRRARVASQLGLLPAPARPSDPEREIAGREMARLLERAIDALPEHFRTVYVLRELEGLDTLETAECLELDPGTVKTRLHRARVALRDALGSDRDGLADSAFPFAGERCNRLVAAVLARLPA